MVFQEINELLDEQEKARQQLSPIRTSLFKFLEDYGQVKRTHWVDRHSKNWGEEYLSLEVQGSYWEDVPLSEFSEEDSHEVVRSRKPVVVEINTISCHGSDKDPDILVSVDVSGWTREYHLDSKSPEDSGLKIILSKNIVIGTSGWEECVNELSLLIDWLQDWLEKED